MVVETSRSIADVARELGLNEATLGYWVEAYRNSHAGDGRSWVFPSVRGCGSWNGGTVSWRWRMRS